MSEPIIISINDKTVSNLLKNGETRFRRKGYAFKKLVITEAQFPEGYEVALSKTRDIMYVRKYQMEALYYSGDITVVMGMTRFKFILDSCVNKMVMTSEPIMQT